MSAAAARLEAAATRGLLGDREKAAELVSGGAAGQVRLAVAAGVPGVAAARGERAAGRRGGQVRRLARDVVQPADHRARVFRQRLEQRLGVRVARGGEQRRGGGGFHHPPGVHDRDPVGAAGDDAQVVGDQDDRHPQPAAQVVDQLQDLLGDGDVQRGGRLVGDQQLGLAGQRHGDHHALPHAAGQLVRVAGHPLGGAGHADQPEHLHRAVQRGPPAGAAVQPDRLGDLVADGLRRVQRGQRVLEDHPDQVPADVLHLVLGQRGDVRAVDGDPPGGDVAAAGQQAHDRQRGHRLAAAGFADDAQALARLDGEADPGQGVHHRPAQPDLGVQVLDLQQGRHRRCSLTSNASRRASPMKLIAMTTRMMAMPAGKICHQ